MIEQIKELIVLYAPTVVNYLKIFKGLKQENLQRELAETQRLLAQQAKDNAEIKQLNRELINEVSKVKKYENISTDKKI